MKSLLSSFPNNYLNPKKLKTIDTAEHKLVNGPVIVTMFLLIIVSKDITSATINGICAIVTVEIIVVKDFLFLVFNNKIINEYTKIPIAGASIFFNTERILLNTLEKP